MPSCLPLDDPQNQWNFCPSKIPAYLFAICFGLSTCFHIFQGIKYKKVYSWVVAMGGVWQLLAFVFRIISIDNPTNGSMYSIWFILILVAPLWINAFVYMVMGRMIYNFLPAHKLFGIKAWRFGLYFVLLDITAFLVQAGGASIASGSNVSDKTVLLGIHIYMGGIGLQEIFIICFSVLAYRFHRKLTREGATNGTGNSPWALLYTIYAVLTLITIRIVFRLIEYASGFKSQIPKHEAYMYVFDSLPMLVALVLFNVFHPGSVMPGKASDFPSRKERKSWKKQTKAKDMGGDHTLLPVAQSQSPYASRDVSPNRYEGYAGHGAQGESYDPYTGPGYAQPRSDLGP